MVTLIACFVFVPYLIHGEAFLLGYDMRAEYLSFFEELRTNAQAFLQDGKPVFYSWVEFLGNDCYSTKLFYFNDLFDYFFAFTKLHYSTVIMLETYLKFLIAAISFQIYSEYRGHSDRTSLIGGLLFAFSAYVSQIMMHPFLASYVVFLPLYFHSIDRYLRTGKTGMFTFMVFFQFLNNYYLFYSTSLFTILYFIWCWYDLHENGKGFWKEAIRLIGYYLIGFLMSGFAVLPEVLYILSNPRIGDTSTNPWFYESIKPYLNWIVSVFTPTNTLVNRGTPIQELYYSVTSGSSVLGVFFWAGSVSTILFAYRIKAERKNKVHVRLFLVILLLSLIPFGSSLMHGLSEPSFRWLVNVLFLSFAVVLPQLDCIEELDSHCILKLTYGLAVLLVVSPYICAILEGEAIGIVNNEIWLFVVFAICALFNGYALAKKNEKGLLLTIVAELCVTTYFTFYGSPMFRGNTNEGVAFYENATGEKNALNRFLYSLDEANETSFYRIYVDKREVYGDWSQNLNLNGNIMGVMTYDSTVNSSSSMLKKFTDSDADGFLSWAYNIKQPELLTLLSVKYAVVKTEDAVPFTHYSYCAEYDGFQIYENTDYVGLGKTYTRINEYGSCQDALHYVMVDESDLEEEIAGLLGQETIAIEVGVKGKNSLYAYAETSEQGFAVLSIPYHRGWQVQVNGKTVKTYSVNGGLTGFALEAGSNEINFSFFPVGLKKGLLLSLLGFGLFIFTQILHRKVRREE